MRHLDVGAVHEDPHGRWVLGFHVVEAAPVGGAVVPGPPDHHLAEHGNDPQVVHRARHEPGLKYEPQEGGVQGQRPGIQETGAVLRDQSGSPGPVLLGPEVLHDGRRGLRDLPRSRQSDREGPSGSPGIVRCVEARHPSGRGRRPAAASGSSTAAGDGLRPPPVAAPESRRSRRYAAAGATTVAARRPGTRSLLVSSFAACGVMGKVCGSLHRRVSANLAQPGPHRQEACRRRAPRRNMVRMFPPPSSPHPP